MSSLNIKALILTAVFGLGMVYGVASLAVSQQTVLAVLSK